MVDSFLAGERNGTGGLYVVARGPAARSVGLLLAGLAGLTVVTAGQYRLNPDTKVETVPDGRKDIVQNATTASAGMLP